MQTIDQGWKVADSVPMKLISLPEPPPQFPTSFPVLPADSYSSRALGSATDQWRRDNRASSKTLAKSHARVIQTVSRLMQTDTRLGRALDADY